MSQWFKGIQWGCVWKTNPAEWGIGLLIVSVMFSALWFEFPLLLFSITCEALYLENLLHWKRNFIPWENYKLDYVWKMQRCFLLLPRVWGTLRWDCRFDKPCFQKLNCKPASLWTLFPISTCFFNLISVVFMLSVNCPWIKQVEHFPHLEQELNPSYTDIFFTETRLLCDRNYHCSNPSSFLISATVFFSITFNYSKSWYLGRQAHVLQ